MWKAYTRESPAKPGWAIGGMFIAFATTLVLAQWTVGHRQASALQELNGWPITFMLPKSGHWMKAQAKGLFDGSRRKNEAYYIGHLESTEQCWLIVSCDPDSDGPQLVEMIDKGFRTLVGDAQPIQIGPLKGVLTSQVGEDGELMLEAVANGHNRLEVRIILVGNGANKTEMKRAMREVCESVKLKAG